MTDDLDYLLERSETEAIRSIQALHPAAAAAHEELSRRYTDAALAQLAEAPLIVAAGTVA